MFTLWIVILLMGAGLRFDALMQDARFHVDESLFATFARGAAVHGDWMLGGALDKPPLAIYLSALGMSAFGVVPDSRGVLHLDIYAGEFAARAPHALIGVICIALTGALAHALEPRRPIVALAAAALVAVSPLMIRINAGAFTDTLMLAGGLAALIASVRDRPVWAGAALALAFASKQQGVYFVPLAALILLTHTPRTRSRMLRAALTLGAGIALLLVWDAARPEDSLFALAAANNDPVRVLPRLDELPARITAWGGFLAAGFGGAWAAGLVLAGAAYALMRAPLRLRLIVGYAFLYGTAHVLIRFNTYDRYALPVIPLIALGAAWTLAHPPARRPLLILVTIGTVLGLMLTAAPLPPDERWHDRDFPALMDSLNAKPLGAIVYDHALGWHTGYYIGAWSDKRRVYYPDPESLAADAPRNPDRAPRYLIAPRSMDVQAWLDALESVGFAVRIDYANAGFISYQVTPPQTP